MVYQELAVCPGPDRRGQRAARPGARRLRLPRRDDEPRPACGARWPNSATPRSDPDAPVSTLSPAARQVVEIARALLDRRARCSSSTSRPAPSTQEDADRLFDLVRRLKAQGVTVVYISHFLEEIEAVADRFTVLRDGQAVGGGRVGEVPRERIIEMMVGRAVDEQYPRMPHAIGEPVLESDRTRRRPSCRAASSLTLHRGEILGIAGIVGSGRTELLRAVYGLDPVRSGDGDGPRGHVGPAATPARAHRARGSGMLSEDRKDEGLALEMSIADNVTYPADAVPRLGLLDDRGRGRRPRGVLGAARRAVPRPAAAGRRAERRQPAEGGAGPALPPGGRRAAARRADEGRGRRQQGRDLPADRRAAAAAARRCWWSAATCPAVAEDGEAVGHGLDLLEEVADVDDRHPAGLQPQ